MAQTCVMCFGTTSLACTTLTVGGKKLLGEMITNLSDLGVAVPNGFATTAQAFNDFLEQSGVNQRIYQLLDQTDVDDVVQLAKAGAQIRQWVIDTPFHAENVKFIRLTNSSPTASRKPPLRCAPPRRKTCRTRPCRPARNLPQRAGHRRRDGGDQRVRVAVQRPRHRVHQGYDHRGVALSAGVQRMVRSDLASSGVMFTIDTESGFDQVVFITSAFGLGEMVVQGAVNPDEFYVHKPTLQNGKPAIVRRNLG